jgi:hypothetical protein
MLFWTQPVKLNLKYCPLASIYVITVIMIEIKHTNVAHLPIKTLM